MDSLTHIVVGAAVGDLILGKKIGNRGMVLGALAGSVPDFDVFTQLLTDDLGGLELHRAFTHSWVFMFTAPLLLAWLMPHWYRGAFRRWPGYPWLRGMIFVLIYLILAAGLTWITTFLAGWYGLIPGILGLTLGGVIFYNYYHAQIRGFADHMQEPESVGFGQWYLLFALNILIHIVLDCATSYGTQIWYPFSNERVAWGNMAVVDLLFTLPLALTVSIAAALPRSALLRKFLLVAGLVVSSIYWAGTWVNKDRVNGIWKETLRMSHLEPSQSYASPTLTNNVLWHGVAVAGDSVYVGDYALTDKNPVFRITNRYAYWSSPPPDLAGTRAWRILTWFSKGYYHWQQEGEGYSFTDLRFGGIPSEGDDEGVFRFHLVKNGMGDWQVDGGREGNGQDIRAGLHSLWVRMKGLP